MSSCFRLCCSNVYPVCCLLFVWLFLVVITLFCFCLFFRRNLFSLSVFALSAHNKYFSRQVFSLALLLLVLCLQQYGSIDETALDRLSVRIFACFVFEASPSNCFFCFGGSV